MSTYHIPVLLQEVITHLSIRKNGRYIDATLGGGGHTLAIANKGGHVLGIDTDEDSLSHFKENTKNEENIIVAKGNFRDIKDIAQAHGFDRVDGILFDLGVSSYQLDTGERGFSFMHDAPLDMRMDRSLGVTAADLLAVLNKKELTDLFSTLGEERFAYGIAKDIVARREKQPIKTTQELVDIITRHYRRSDEHIHPATRVFQALRIAVNDELESMRQAVAQSVELLDAHGRIAIISFHSLEDRIAKEMFLSFQEEGKGHILTKKPITPTEKEKEENRRSRSAKLRVFEKN